MPRFRVHRMKQTPCENFRWSAHTGGLAIVKAKDYDAGEEIDASSPYAAWKTLAGEGRALRPGDMLEILDEGPACGELQIAKYIGFEPAKWYVPEPKPATDALTAEAPASSELVPPLVI